MKNNKINLFYVLLICTCIDNFTFGLLTIKDERKKSYKKTDFEFSMPQSVYQNKKYKIKVDFAFSLPKNKNQKLILFDKAKEINKDMEKDKIPIYYLLSLFCKMKRFDQFTFKSTKFGDIIFGKTDEIKNLKDFVPSFFNDSVKKNYFVSNNLKYRNLIFKNFLIDVFIFLTD
jgi:hypothetical protein